MTPKKHGKQIAKQAHDMILKKYEAGQKEHGGKLWLKRGLLNMAIEEALDQVVYLLTLKEQYERDYVELGEIDE